MVTLIYNGQTITLDATVNENHSTEVNITEQPIETGAKITDHIQPKPDSLRLDAVITDFPIGPLKAQGSKGRAVALYQQIKGLQLAATLFEVRTGIERYQNMAIKSMSPMRNKDTKGAVKFSIAFQRVTLVDSQTVPVKITKVRKAQGKVTGGKQTGENASEQEKRKSFAATAVDAVSALWKKGEVK
jgi:hypothetical protein